jgi:hypothetical protein
MRFALVAEVITISIRVSEASGFNHAKVVIQDSPAASSFVDSRDALL